MLINVVNKFKIDLILPKLITIESSNVSQLGGGPTK